MNDDTPTGLRYWVFTNESIKDLSVQIEKYASEGWEPQGGVAVTTFSTGSASSGYTIKFSYAQAMIKRP